MTSKISDLNVNTYESLKTPAEFLEEYPVLDKSEETIIKTRKIIQDILDNEDNRKIIILGPCSIRTFSEAFKYAEKVAELQEKVKDRFLLIMRTYFEKPRSTVGWKGLLNDPDIDGSFKLEKGLEEVRKILLGITSIGVPTGTEFLGPVTPQYIGDLISWAAIGARTSESQTHREMASGLSMPIGFKNSTSGFTGSAINAIISSKNPHYFLGIDLNGKISSISTKGNKYCHIILRGGNGKINYDSHSIEKVKTKLQNKKLSPGIIVDCSHGNSGKDYKKQPEVFRDVFNQMLEEDCIKGVMLESNLFEGKQSIPDESLEGVTMLKEGISITDSCLGWEETEKLVLEGYDILKKKAR